MGEAGRVLVAVAGLSIDDETIRVACKMAKPGARIYVLTILEMKRSEPLGAPVDVDQDDRTEAVLSRAEALIKEHGFENESEIVQARETGPAIVGEADEWKAELIVMGLPYKRRFGDFYMGRTVPYVLKYAPCRVILFREHLNP